MYSSVMPAHVLRKAVVGVEFMAKAVTSAMESQQVELMPVMGIVISVDETQIGDCGGLLHTRYTRVEQVSQGDHAV